MNQYIDIVFSKRNVLTFSLLAFLAFSLFGFLARLDICSMSLFCDYYIRSENTFMLIIFVPALFFSIVASFLKKEVFRVWAIFALFSLPLLVWSLSGVSNMSGGSWLGVGQAFAALVFMGLIFSYCVASTVLLVVASAFVYGGAKKK